MKTIKELHDTMLDIYEKFMYYRTSELNMVTEYKRLCDVDPDGKDKVAWDNLTDIVCYCKYIAENGKKLGIID
jgi:hypothetical protein